jgi:hypothetical protein
MPHAADARLGRLEDCAAWQDPAGSGRRGRLRFIVAACAAIRDAAVAAAIDPATISALRLGEEAAAELAALGETPEQERDDHAAAVAREQEWQARHPDEPDPRDELIAEFDRLGRRYGDSGMPLPGESLFGWYAWAECSRPA